MVTFNLVVGNQYPVSNGKQNVQLTFLGLVSNGTKKALLFDNPQLLGYAFPFIGAMIEVIYPNIASPTIVIDARIRARLVGNTSSDLQPIHIIDGTWGPANGS